MDLEAMLGIDYNDPGQRHAQHLVEADERLLDALVAMRRAKHLTQDAVGKAMNISQAAVARIESGERDPHLSTLRRYAMAVGALISHDVKDVSVERFVRTRDYLWDSDVAATWENDRPLVAKAGRSK